MLKGLFHPMLPQLMSDNPAALEIKTADRLLAAYATGQRNFANLSLTTADLSGANLKGADLSYADLNEANLSDANLRGVDLSYARLSEANLQGANLRGAMLIGTDLRDAQLANASLEEADYDPGETRFPSDFDIDAANMRSDR